METLEERELKSVLLEENTKEVERCTREAESLCVLLTNINELYAIENSEQLPSDIDELIFSEALKRDSFLAEMHKRKSLTLDEISLPNELITLRDYLYQFKRMGKETLGCVYKRRKEGRFVIDKVLFENVLNKWRVYASTPEQIKRYHQAEVILEAIVETIKNHGISLNTHAHIHWNNFRCPVGLKKDRPQIDNHWILTGQVGHLYSSNPAVK